MLCARAGLFMFPSDPLTHDVGNRGSNPIFCTYVFVHRLFIITALYKVSVLSTQFLGKGYARWFASAFPAQQVRVPAIARLLFAKDTVGIFNVQQLIPLNSYAILPAHVSSIMSL